MSKYIIFLVKSFLGNFYRHLVIFFWSHCCWVSANPFRYKLFISLCFVVIYYFYIFIIGISHSFQFLRAHEHIGRYSLCLWLVNALFSFAGNLPHFYVQRSRRWSHHFWHLRSAVWIPSLRHHVIDLWTKSNERDAKNDPFIVWYFWSIHSTLLSVCV